jgi:hypothetical protein
MHREGPVSNASRSAPEACLVGSGTSGTPTPNIGCRELECPRALEGRAMNERGSQLCADKWTVIIWAYAALMLRAGPRQKRGLFHDELVADSERFKPIAAVVVAAFTLPGRVPRRPRPSPS